MPRESGLVYLPKNESLLIDPLRGRRLSPRTRGEHNVSDNNRKRRLTKGKAGAHKTTSGQTGYEEILDEDYCRLNMAPSQLLVICLEQSQQMT